MLLLKNKVILPLLAVVCVISVIAAIILACNTGVRETEFMPPPFDSGAVVGSPDLENDPSFAQVDAKAYKFGVCGKVLLKENNAQLYLSNYTDSGVWLKVRVYDSNNTLLGESGLIREGEYLQYVAISHVPDGEKLILRVMAYEPDTYYSAGAVTLNAMIIKEETQ